MFSIIFLGSGEIVYGFSSVFFWASTGKKLWGKKHKKFPWFVFFYFIENISDVMKKFPSSNGENVGESALFSSIDKLHYMNWELH